MKWVGGCVRAVWIGWYGVNRKAEDEVGGWIYGLEVSQLMDG